MPNIDDGLSIPEKARAILASMIGAVAVAKSIDQEDEREALLLATQKQICLLLGLNVSELNPDTPPSCAS